jgi:TIP41-like family
MAQAGFYFLFEQKTPCEHGEPINSQQSMSLLQSNGRIRGNLKWKHTMQSNLNMIGQFTTDYCGTVGVSRVNNGEENGGDDGEKQTSSTDIINWERTSDQMDRALLTNRDPILFFDELLLYESELEDNGLSSLSVKIRVMPKCWYVLLRFFLRVDGVMVRLRETRWFCHFCSSESNSDSNLDAESGGGGGGEGEGKKPATVVVLREVKHQEGTFEELKKSGAPPEGPAYTDGDTAAVALAAVAPIGLTKYVLEKLII